MRIMHVIPSLKKGGAERLTVDICNHLQLREGVEVLLVTLSNVNDYVHLCEKVNIIQVNADVTPSIKGEDLVELNEFKKIIDSFNPNIIHTHLFKAEITAKWEANKGVKYFTHCHDNMKQLKSFSLKDIMSKKRITELYERRLILKRYRRVNNKFIVISKDSLKYFEQNLPSDLKMNIKLLPNAIDYKRFFLKQSLRSNDCLKIINIGNFLPNKNPLFIVQIAKNLKEMNVFFEIKMIGDGFQRKETEKRVNELKLNSYFTFTGYVNQVEQHLWDSSLYVHSSKKEAFGLTIIEAMASGLPVITLDGKGNRDLIEEGKNGHMIYEEDPKLFAEKIIEVWENKKKYQEMSKYAQKFAKQYDIHNYIDRLLEVYASK